MMATPSKMICGPIQSELTMPVAIAKVEIRLASQWGTQYKQRLRVSAPNRLSPADKGLLKGSGKLCLHLQAVADRQGELPINPCYYYPDKVDGEKDVGCVILFRRISASPLSKVRPILWGWGWCPLCRQFFHANTRLRRLFPKVMNKKSGVSTRLSSIVPVIVG